MFAWLLPPDSDHAMIHLGNYNCSVCTYSLARCSTWQIAQLWPPKWVITWQQGCKSKHVSWIRLLKIVKRMTTWKKYPLLTLWRMQSQWQVFLFPINFELGRLTSHKQPGSHVWFQNGRIRICFFQGEFLQDSRHFRDRNFTEWKSWNNYYVSLL